MPTFYEFFAGGGMARAGLGLDWQCLFANDFDPKKAKTYANNWRAEALRVGDVASVKVSELPSRADLVWASFPCQDLSLAGAGAGLDGDRSGTFWPFWDLVRQLGKDGRSPKLIVLENVCGALTSHGGKDFAAISSALTGGGYRFGAVVIDAVNFLPQSRPRLFIIGVASDQPIPRHLRSSAPSELWHTEALLQAFNSLSGRAKAKWIWWNLPQPAPRQQNFSELIEESPSGVTWHTKAETKRLLELMTDLNLAKVKKAQASGRKMVGGLYRRTRPNELGQKVQRAEVRFDDIAGCLRTPSGGSSRQTILVIENKSIRSRLLSPREAARLMGLPDEYRLPSSYNEAYHLAGDGVAVPVVRFLAENLLEPLLLLQEEEQEVA
ncbi:MAG: DNA cytosine methyltransferase [Thiobacillus sp.]|nr:DNA cytosine methyltransferase [Thiobacillus sp.]MDP3125599.1 DNA cytosine methyltransferase [Thiobacillus sp.]